MLDELKTREQEGQPIQVGLVGLGSMGNATAYQIGQTPGMRLAFVADTDEAAAKRAAETYAKPTRITTMMEEIEMWGFDIVQAGNMKGFMDRHRDSEGTVEIASKLNLSTTQCALRP